MAARGVKRSEEASAPPQKKARADPKVASVKQTIESADLSETEKAMLLAMLPHSLSVPKDLRSELQSKAVDMVGEVFDAVELKLKHTAEKESAKVTEIEASRGKVDAALIEAESRHSATTATMETCKLALAQCFGTTNERKNAVAASEKAERTGNASGLVVEEEHAALKCALEEHLKALKEEGSWETGPAQGHLDALLPFATRYADESLVSALPNTCIKPPAERSTFDNMVIDQLEASLKSRFAQLTADIETEKPAKAQRGADVVAAKQIFKEAEGLMLKASEECASALAAQKETLAVLQLAKSDAAAFKSTLKKAKEAADEAQAEFELFHDNCRVGCFDSLKMKVSVVEATPACVTESTTEVSKVEEITSSTTSNVTVGGC